MPEPQRRRNPRIRTLTPDEHAAACAAWALKYPEPLDAASIRRTMTIRQRLATLLASDITKVVAGAIILAAAGFFWWQVPTTLYAMQQIKDVQGLSTVVEDNRELHNKLDARLDADEREIGDTRRAVGELSVSVEELRKSQDQNFKLLLQRLPGGPR